MDGASIAITIIGVLVGFGILYLVVKLAITNGLKDHQDWMEGRAKDAPASD